MTCLGSYKPLQEKEDWDEEIQEVTLKIREKMDVVTMPYGKTTFSKLDFSRNDFLYKLSSDNSMTLIVCQTLT